ncbi:MAG: cytochrome c1, partial [Gammaproteobacteria bacterium]|nr:cytochrome c1 [Gammaproteobacteria bacterium]
AAACLASFAAPAATEGEVIVPANNNIANRASLQRGAKYFVNYCLGCHSAQYVRYNKLAEGLGLTEQQLIDNLMFTGEQPFDTMSNAMRDEDAARWFGVAPPDLSLMARARGTDYIFSFLRSFYADPSTATGSNNLVLPNTAMPHVLWELQGVRQPVYEGGESSANPDEAAEIVGFEVVREGTLSEAEYDQVARDIVNFLDYIAEPMQQERQALGIKVIGFLLVFLLIAYLLKKEIWKDVE